MAFDRGRLERRLSALVNTPSVTGDERVAVDLVTVWLAEVADEVDRWTESMVRLEQDPAYPGREVEREDVPVVAASLRGRRPGPTVVLTGHVDTVPVGDPSRWSRSPFGAEIEDGRLYGRGACDMKGGIVAALEAFTVIASAGRDFAGELRFVAVPGEEDGGTGTLAAIRRGWGGDFVILTEPTYLAGRPQIVTAHGGALTFRIEVDGRSAHGSTPHMGESALEHFTTVYRAMQRMEAELCAAETDPRMTALGVPYATSVGIVHGGEWASNVMESITAEVRTGVALGETIEEAERRFADQLAAAVSEDRWLGEHPPRVRRTGAAFGSASIDPDHAMVTALIDAAFDVTGTRPVIAGAPYGCDMAMWVRVGGSDAVVFGPGDVAAAHAPDEWVSLGEVAWVAEVLVETTHRLLH